MEVRADDNCSNSPSETSSSSDSGATDTDTSSSGSIEVSGPFANTGTGRADPSVGAASFGSNRSSIPAFCCNQRSGPESAASSSSTAGPASAASTAQANVASHGASEWPAARSRDKSLWFTPKTIDPKLCMARTWNKGHGGQCPRTCTTGDLCTTHAKNDKWKVHGRVDGPIPDAKLEEFLRSAPPRDDKEEMSTFNTNTCNKRKSATLRGKSKKKRNLTARVGVEAKTANQVILKKDILASMEIDALLDHLSNPSKSWVMFGYLSKWSQSAEGKGAMRCLREGKIAKETFILALLRRQEKQLTQPQNVKRKATQQGPSPAPPPRSSPSELWKLTDKRGISDWVQARVSDIVANVQIFMVPSKWKSGLKKEAGIFHPDKLDVLRNNPNFADQSEQELRQVFEQLTELRKGM